IRKFPAPTLIRAKKNQQLSGNFLLLLLSGQKKTNINQEISCFYSYQGKKKPTVIRKFPASTLIRAKKNQQLSGNFLLLLLSGQKKTNSYREISSFYFY